MADLTYEVSKNNGTDYTGVGATNMHTFTELSSETEYTIKIKASNPVGSAESEGIMHSTDALAASTVTIAESSVTVGEGEMTTLTATGSTGNTYVWACTGTPPATLANAYQATLTFTAPMVDANVQYTCTVTATGDGTHALSTTATALATVTITNTDTTAPSFGTFVITDKVYTHGEEIAPVVLPVATDAGSTTEASLTYQLSGLPSGLVFQENTRTLSGTPENAHPATAYSYIATDEAGNRSAELTFTISVLDTTAPGFGDLGIANQVYTPGEEIAPVVLPAAVDVVSTTDSSLTYQLSGLPSGLAFQESTRTLSGTPENAQPATEYSYTATDEAGNRSAELTFMITVGDVVAVVVDLESSISVYPNPSETSFFITLPQSMSAKTIEVTMVSVLGKRAEIEVERKEGTRDISGMLILPVSHLSSGNYVINLRSGNVKFSKQVVVR